MFRNKFLSCLFICFCSFSVVFAAEVCEEQPASSVESDEFCKNLFTAFQEEDREAAMQYIRSISVDAFRNFVGDKFVDILGFALVCGDLEALKYLLELSGRITKKSAFGIGRLSAVAGMGRLESLKVALNSLSPEDCVEMLQDNQNLFRETPLHAAAKKEGEVFRKRISDYSYINVINEILSKVSESERVAFVDRLNRHGQSAWDMSPYLQRRYPMTCKRKIKKLLTRSFCCDCLYFSR